MLPLNPYIRTNLNQRRLMLKAGLGLISSSLLLPDVKAQKLSADAIKERHAFIEAASKEHWDSLKLNVIVDKDPNDPPPPAAYIRISTLMPFGDWDYYYVKDGSIGWGPSPPPSDDGLIRPIKLEVQVPEGFVTDLASIPRAFWGIKRPEGRHAYAAVIHDYLYWTQRRTRKESDEIFREVMLESKTDKTTVWGLYNTVREAGGKAWENNRRLKDKGEKRFLQILPEDHLVSWKDYKKQAGVFVKSEQSL
jgi:hypothetical protein